MKTQKKMSKLIVIVGITGNQGGSVAKAFLKEPGWKIRGVTRDPHKASNKHLIDAGIELVAADLDNLESLRNAFAGATAIFGVTDFWQFPRDPGTQKIAAEKEIAINEAAFERELQQAKNIIDAAAQTGPPLQRFVFSTLSDTKKWSKGKITHNYHFDAKAEATKYLQSAYPELADKTCYLQVGYYMMNWKGLPVMGIKKQEDGNYVVRLPSSSNPKQVPWVHPPNDNGHYVRALVNAPAGSTMLGYSTKATMVEFCELWTRIMRERGLIGATLSCTFDGSLTIEDMDRLIPGGIGREIGESCVYSAEFGFDGGDPDVKSPESLGVQPELLTSLEDYIRTEDWSSVL